ncbi:MAG: pyruvate, phosphate dikinase [Actinomycetota bacterium]
MPKSAASPKNKSTGTSKPKKAKLVYAFSEGRKEMKDLLGGKGANLAEMTRLELPVPPGFTVTTQACREYMRSRKLPPTLMDEVRKHLKALEKAMGRKLGDPDDPLLVSVRSGAKFSMPGMMDTVLNLGLNDKSVIGLAKVSNNERFAWDAYRRFIQMFGRIVMNAKGDSFEHALDQAKKNKGVKADTELDSEDLRKLVDDFKRIVKEETGKPFPTDPQKQLEMAITAVFDSWNGDRARLYRKQEKISDALGTAVSVVAMVFGNMGEDSGTGVAFTRDPATGASGNPYGDYLANAQGEDVVAGIRNTLPLADLEKINPKAYKQLQKIMRTLERHYRDMCDIEFTIERGKLWMLQTRVGKRTAAAAVKLAMTMRKEKLIDDKEAIKRVTPEQIDMLLHPQVDEDRFKGRTLATGLNASPGAAVGVAVFDADRAEERAATEKVILVRRETNPDDLNGMIAAQGILTSRGGKTSHAAVVARGMGKPCVCGADALDVDVINKRFSVNGTVIKEGDLISIDGTTGKVFEGEVPLKAPEVSGDFEALLKLADKFRRLKIRANADTPEDAAKAREFGAQGIGLARTEHMFLGDRRPLVEHLILASDEDQEKKALDELQPLQKEDFKGILKAMDGLPVTIRLLDPPLHEFLPDRVELAVELATAEAKREQVNAERKSLQKAVESMHESNPMLGMRGVRLGMLRPGLYEMQVRAIMEAACELKAEGKDPIVEIMIPLVGIVEEMKRMREMADRICKEVIKQKGVKLRYLVGTMIELPRAALIADQIAEHAQFFSFGTNDLTQTTFGLSRDDVAPILDIYVTHGLLKVDPFTTLDREGVGKLVKMATELGRKSQPGLKLGICGEHGGDPDSIAFCHETGLDYVSCSPFRVPVARLAAAHAALGASEQASK